jgi:hypothetical protein
VNKYLLVHYLPIQFTWKEERWYVRHLRNL